jgi:hypothetical protein
VAIVSLLAALGYYTSPILWARCVPGWERTLGPLEPTSSWQVRTDGFLRDGDGGVYWLLVSLLPGFRSFRYPPKLFVCAALAVSGLAAIGWDRLLEGRSRRARAIAAGWLLASLAALLAAWLGAGPLRAWFDGLAATFRTSDEPLDAPRALADLHRGLVQGAVVSAFALGIVRLAGHRPRLAGALAVAGLVVDLCLANAGHVVTVPQAAFEGVPKALEALEAAEREHPAPGAFRVQRVGRWWPTSWIDPTGKPRDFAVITRWERDTLRPNFNLPVGVRSTFYHDTIEPVDYGMFFLPWMLRPDESTRQLHQLDPGQKVWYFPRRGFDLWNTRYFIVPGRLVWDSPTRGYAAFLRRTTPVYPAPGAFDGPGGSERRARWEATEDFRIYRNEAAFPRAWVVHRAYLIPPVKGLRVADRARLMQKILYQGDEFWRAPGVPVRDPRTTAWVETERPRAVDPLLSRAEPDPSEVVTVTRDEPQRLELSAVLRSPGLVVVADLFYPGWRLTVDGRPAEILRTNRAMRGEALPAGAHRLVFTYDPTSFRAGAALSLVGMVVLGVLGAWALRPSAGEGLK